MGNNCVKTAARRTEAIRKRGLIPSGETPMTAAIQAQLWDCLDALLVTDVDTNIPNLSAQTPLMLAVRQGNLQVVKLLLDHGADVHATDNMGMMALHLACIRHQVDIGHLLLELGADPEGGATSTSQSGPSLSTPLRLAVDTPCYELAVALIKHGADPNRPDTMWWNTPFLKACQYGHHKMVQALLPVTTDLCHANRSGLTALDVAVANNYYSIAQTIISHVPNNTYTNRSKTRALIASIIIRCRQSYHLLMDSGMDYNKSVEDNKPLFTPLGFALTDWRNTNTNTLTDMHFSLNNGRVYFARDLINKGVDITAIWQGLVDVPGSAVTSTHENVFMLCIQAFGLDLSFYDTYDHRKYKTDTLFRTLSLQSLDEATLLLCDAGYTPSECDIVVTKNRINTGKCGIKLAGQLSQRRCNPRSLQNICVINIRQQIPDNVIYKVKKLQLPKQINDIITLGPVTE